MPASRARTLAILYFGGHAVLDLVWWAAVGTVDRFRGWFELAPHNHRVLNGFLLPDLVLLGVASFVAAVGLQRRWRGATVLAALTSGGSGYATLYIISWVVTGGHGWMGAVAMSIETGVMVALVVALVRLQPE